MIQWFFLLLPLAALSGWWLARRRSQTQEDARRPDPAYFHGLNYLLDERPDKAIEVFLKLSEFDQETAEIQLALGGLFRRRGEVERAIRIHQGLVARSSLDRQIRSFALYELGQDYLHAGLFDRAERLFRELIEGNRYPERASRGLLTIYQQEREWSRCMEVAQHLQALTGRSMQTEIAHYHCERAEDALHRGDVEGAERALEAARAADAGCARVTFIRARQALKRGAPEEALDELCRGGAHGLVGELLPDLSACYRGQPARAWVAALQRLEDGSGNTALILALSEALERAQDPQAAADRLIAYLHRYADLRVVERLVQLAARNLGADPLYRTIGAVLAHLNRHQPTYRCEHCGFMGNHLHWQCPSCRHWGSIHPIRPPRREPRHIADLPPEASPAGAPPFSPSRQREAKDR